MSENRYQEKLEYFRSLRRAENNETCNADVSTAKRQSRSEIVVLKDEVDDDQFGWQTLVTTPKLPAGGAPANSYPQTYEPSRSLKRTMSDNEASPEKAARDTKSITPRIPRSIRTELPSELILPPWYMSLKVIGRRVTYNRSRLDILTSLRNTIAKCSELTTEELMPLFDKIRGQIHNIEFLEVDEILIKKSKLLEANVGFPKLFHEAFNLGIEYPFDIKGDAKTLFLRWRRQDFNPDMFRGIIDGKTSGGGKKRYTARLDEEYTNKISANFYGTGHLQSGAWFPSQLCALRDGAHGSAQGGIHGHDGKGAFSIVLSNSYYDDKDEGETIAYCGTEGSNGQMTDATQRMMESVNLSNPIRVLRSHNLSEHNPYRPVQGIRYDGVYVAVGQKLLNEEKQHYQFLLRRQPDQGPIRSQDPWRRPTHQELAAYNKHRTLTCIESNDVEINVK